MRRDAAAHDRSARPCPGSRRRSAARRTRRRNGRAPRSGPAERPGEHDHVLRHPLERPRGLRRPFGAAVRPLVDQEQPERVGRADPGSRRTRGGPGPGPPCSTMSGIAALPARRRTGCVSSIRTSSPSAGHPRGSPQASRPDDAEPGVVDLVGAVHRDQQRGHGLGDPRHRQVAAVDPAEVGDVVDERTRPRPWPRRRRRRRTRRCRAACSRSCSASPAIVWNAATIRDALGQDRIGLLGRRAVPGTDDLPRRGRRRPSRAGSCRRGRWLPGRHRGLDRAVDVGLPGERDRDDDDLGRRGRVLVRRAVDVRRRRPRARRAFAAVAAPFSAEREPIDHVVSGLRQAQRQAEALRARPADHRDVHRPELTPSALVGLGERRRRCCRRCPTWSRTASKLAVGVACLVAAVRSPAAARTSPGGHAPGRRRLAASCTPRLLA